jgi:hypothetical protein
VEEVGRSIGGDVADECGRPDPEAAIYRRASINSPHRVAGRPSATAFTARRRRCARGRQRCAEDETMRTTTAHSRRQVRDTRRAGIFVAFSRVFLSFVWSPRARLERPGMAWARWMDEGPDPGENEDPGARLGRFTPSG